MKTARMLVILIVALGLPSMSLAAEDTWTIKSPMPTARWDLSTCVVDGKIFAIGGASGYAGRALRTVEEYNPATDIWTTKSEMPTARQGLSTSVVNGKIYAIGGIDASGGSYPSAKTFSIVEEFDPATDTWTTKSEIPTGRGYHSANVVDGRIYVFGGATSCPWCAKVMTLEVYDPATDTWTRKGNIPRPICTATTCMVDGKIYAIGGEGTGWRVDEYDPVTDTWIRKANMPSSRTDLSGSVVNGKIYVIGGDVGNAIVANVEVYDPSTDIWTTAPKLPTARVALRTSAVNGKIYAMGGLTNWSSAASGTVEEYDTGLTVSSPDLNGDGTVNVKDLLRLIESWGLDNPMADIAPPPFGDRIVDAIDLEHLMSYWEQPIDDPTLLAHWALDEVEGEVAYDNVGMNNAYIIGEPVWQPDGGMVDGAILLDGVDDTIISGPVLNPTVGTFSVLAWIRGGMPMQTIISQVDGVDWLRLDPLDGALMTNLQSIRRSGSPLLSQTVITDDYWHRIGFVWDGMNRILYVDDVAVAQDIQQDLGGSENGLYIGCGKTMEDGTYFSGLMDDVRIYNRAVIP